MSLDAWQWTLAIVAAAMWFVIAPELDSFTLMTGMAPATILEESLSLTIKTFGAVVAAMKALADEEKLPHKAVADAIVKYGIDPDKPNPATV